MKGTRKKIGHLRTNTGVLVAELYEDLMPTGTEYAYEVMWLYQEFTLRSHELNTVLELASKVAEASLTLVITLGSGE